MDRTLKFQETRLAARGPPKVEIYWVEIVTEYTCACMYVDTCIYSVHTYKISHCQCLQSPQLFRRRSSRAASGNESSKKHETKDHQKWNNTGWRSSQNMCICVYIHTRSVTFNASEHLNPFVDVLQERHLEVCEVDLPAEASPRLDPSLNEVLGRRLLRPLFDGRECYVLHLLDTSR